MPLLVQAFLKESAKENGKPFRELAPEAMACILEYNWPGNVRELRAAIEHAVVMCSTPKIGVRDFLPLSASRPGLGHTVPRIPRIKFAPNRTNPYFPGP